jgi:Uma2 family endonuclease
MMATEIARRAFSVYDYARMREGGILTEDDRVELIDGDIRLMSPSGPQHAAVVSKIVKYLTAQLGDRAIVSPQNPVRLSDYSEPQPDVAVLLYRDDFYAQAHPGASDILILIEVSDSTLAYDRGEKIPRYAAAGVPEVWIVDLAQQMVEQYTAPSRGQYTRVSRLFPGDTITSPTLPGLSLAVGAIVG